MNNSEISEMFKLYSPQITIISVNLNDITKTLTKVNLKRNNKPNINNLMLLFEFNREIRKGAQT